MAQSTICSNKLQREESLLRADSGITCINFGIMVASTLLTLYFYVKSAGPAALEKSIGLAYARCTR